MASKRRSQWTTRCTTCTWTSQLRVRMPSMTCQSYRCTHSSLTLINQACSSRLLVAQGTQPTSLAPTSTMYSTSTDQCPSRKESALSITIRTTPTPVSTLRSTGRITISLDHGLLIQETLKEHMHLTTNKMSPGIHSLAAPPGTFTWTTQRSKWT